MHVLPPAAHLVPPPAAHLVPPPAARLVAPPADVPRARGPGRRRALGSTLAIALALAAVTTGCDGAAGTPSPSAAPPASPVTAAPDRAAPVAPAPDRAAPAPTPAPAAAPSAAAEPVTYDCAALVTAADVKELCGKDATVVRSSDEGQFAITTCARSVKIEGGGWNQIRLQLQPTSPAGARSLVTLDLGGDKRGVKERKVAAGDVAVYLEEPGTSSGRRQSFLAAKGPAYLQLGATTGDRETQICDEDGFVALGRRVVERLP
ncbi:MAG: hypothetical protein HS111_01215 [Kofleriaceae bacterium]|nr:hypothetical protein [Kofleriaceae bacterium]MCL4226997.1 hypothetical protein [Myxococcales bacterium]